MPKGLEVPDKCKLVKTELTEAMKYAIAQERTSASQRDVPETDAKYHFGKVFFSANNMGSNLRPVSDATAAKLGT